MTDRLPSHQRLLRFGKRLYTGFLRIAHGIAHLPVLYDGYSCCIPYKRLPVAVLRVAHYS